MCIEEVCSPGLPPALRPDCGWWQEQPSQVAMASWVGICAAASSVVRWGRVCKAPPPPSPAPPLRKLPRLQALWRGNGSHWLCSWCLIIAQRRHFGFIAFIYYKKSSVCFLKQLSGQIVVDKQCWSVFLRQPKFITFHLFIYFAKLWWCHVFFFK